MATRVRVKLANQRFSTARRALAPKLPDGAAEDATRNGDGAAFEELCTRYQPRLLDLCRRLSDDWDSAQDLTQETFLTALLDFSKFGKRPLWPRLAKIAKHLSRGYRRPRARKPVPYEPHPLDWEKVDAPNGSDSTFDEVVSRQDRARVRARISAGLSCLSKRERLVFVLGDVEQWSHTEIAELAGTSVNAVRNVARRARRRLRSVLEAEPR